MLKLVVNVFTVGVLSILAGCAPAKLPSAYSARSVVRVAPEGAPRMVGTYDFDLLGEAQGQACAELGPLHGQIRDVIVNGKLARYSVSVAGATLEGDDELTRQAQSAAVFTALSGLNGADVMFITRAIVTPESPERLCAHVWGQAVRLKKGGVTSSASEHEPAPSASASAAPLNAPAAMSPAVPAPSAAPPQ